MSTERFVKLTPLLTVVLFSIYLLLVTGLTEVMLMKSHIVGLVTLGIVIIIQLIHREAGYYATLFMNAMGTACIAAFTPTVYTIRIFVIIKIDWICLLLLIQSVIVHRQLVAGIFREYTKK